MGIEKIAEWCLWRIAWEIERDILDPQHNTIKVVKKRRLLRTKYYFVITGDLSIDDIDAIERMGFKLKKEFMNEEGKMEYWFEV